MIKKIGCFIFAVMFILGIQSTFFISRAYAQGNTKVVLSTDKSNYNVGDTVKVTVQAQNVVDLFGVQFTLHYDPSMLSMEGNDFTFADGYTVFGGSTVDKGKGVVTYPVINKNPSPDNKSSVTVGYANFKATKEGPITLSMDNIKSVNSQSVETNYNTQTQSVFNVAKAPSNSGSGGNGTDNNNGNSTGNPSQGNGNNGTGNAGQGSGNTNQVGNGNNSDGGSNSSSTAFNSATTSSSGSYSDGSTSSDGNADGLTASAGGNGNQGESGNTSIASQSENGNSTNQNTASNDAKNSAKGNSQNSSKNDSTTKQTSDSNSKSPLNIILLIVLIVMIAGCAVFGFLNRKRLKDIFAQITNRKN